MKIRAQIAVFAVLLCAALAAAVSAYAVPVTFYQSFAGNINFQVTGATLRTAADGVDSCAVMAAGTTNTAVLSGVPAGATIEAAFLYWAGSGNTDNTVTFEGAARTADRTFTETVDTRNWFAGFEDVTAVVQSKAGGPNGTYSFADLTVTTTGDHCTIATVLAGWGLVVIYEDAAEPLRVINVYDGLQNFWGTSITLNPNNFVIPNTGIDGRFSVLTWEGDAGNSTSRNGLNEDLRFNGTLLIDALNPNQNQYNSTINTLGVNNSYGVDFDTYDIGSTLSPGDTSATTFYSSGQDRVLLNLQVISTTNSPVADLAINKSHSGNFVAGQQGVYSIAVNNNGPSAATGTITVTDTLPAGLTYVSGTGTGWSCGAVGQNVTCTHAGPLASGASLPNITLTVNVAAAASPSVNNTATVANATFDNVAANNSDTDATTVIIPNLTTSTKSVLDLNGGDSNPGDTLRYTITINESNGGAVSGVSVTDTISALLTGFNVVIVPAGATNSSTPGTGPLNITNISVPASGSVTIVFDANVVGTATPGNLINNTAAITNPVDGTVTNAVAPTVVVSQSLIAGSGVKNLYPYFNTNGLSRVVPVANTTTAAINGLGATLTLDMTPSTQSNLTLGAGNISVPLCMQRLNDLTTTRNVDVALSYVATGAGGSTGVIGNQTQTGILGTNGYQLITFTINLAANTTLNANTAIRMVITNSSTTSTTRQIQLSSLTACASASRIGLNTNTVINVDSTQAYNAAYAGGSVLSVYVPNNTLYIRSVISDPFGTVDINGANIQILNPSMGVVVASTAMTMVNDSGAALETYQYQYTIPAVGPTGYWTARVTGIEGTEGTVTDLGVGTFRVAVPSISMTKLVSTISDPVNASNPKAIPGAVMEYQVLVSNSGAGPADTDAIVITDPIISTLQLYLGSPADPAQFINGTPVSGLTYTFISLASVADDVAFSNDGGTSFITPSVDANGFDITVPAINFIRINPKGSLNGEAGAGNPNFTLRYRARVR